jgi:hypothetical protein
MAQMIAESYYLHRAFHGRTDSERGKTYDL